MKKRENKIFNWVNFLALINALNKEPFWLVIRNVLRKVARGSDNNDYHVQKDGFIINLEIVRIYSNRLEIIGWGLGKRGISSIEIFSEKKKIGDANYGEYRIDINSGLKLLYKNVNHCGFSFLQNLDDNPKHIKIKIKDKYSRKVEILVTEIATSIEEQYALIKKSKMHNFSRKEKRISIPKRLKRQITLIIINKGQFKLSKLIESVDGYDELLEKVIIFNCGVKGGATSIIAENISFKVIGYDVEELNNYFFYQKIQERGFGNYLLLVGEHHMITRECLKDICLLSTKVKCFYGDHVFSVSEKINTPFYKPDFSPDLLLSYNYIGGVIGIHKDIFKASIKWVDKIGNRKFSIYKWVLFSTIDLSDTVVHYSNIWSITKNQFRLSETDRHDIKQYLNYNHIKAIVIEGIAEGTYRVKRHVCKKKLVSIIIPFKDKIHLLKKCIEGIVNHTQYDNYEIILMNNKSLEIETDTYLQSISNLRNIKVYNANYEFNYSKINNDAVRLAHGEYILFLNNDTEPIVNGWLLSMLEHAQREEVGAVGAKLLYSDNTIQHAGVVYGISGGAVHIHKNYHSYNNGYMQRINVIQNFSICTAACLLMKRSLFFEVGGFNEEYLSISFNDVDLCLKLRDKGYWIVYTPFAQLYHYESVSRGKYDSKEKYKKAEKEVKYTRNRWKKEFKKGDPFYNKNLSLRHRDFGIDY